MYSSSAVLARKNLLVGAYREGGDIVIHQLEMVCRADALDRFVHLMIEMRARVKEEGHENAFQLSYEPENHFTGDQLRERIFDREFVQRGCSYKFRREEDQVWDQETLPTLTDPPLAVRGDVPAEIREMVMEAFSRKG